jgi:hypothetical protein
LLTTSTKYSGLYYIWDWGRFQDEISITSTAVVPVSLFVCLFAIGPNVSPSLFYKTQTTKGTSSRDKEMSQQQLQLNAWIDQLHDRLSKRQSTLAFLTDDKKRKTADRKDVKTVCLPSLFFLWFATFHPSFLLSFWFFKQPQKPSSSQESARPVILFDSEGKMIDPTKDKQEQDKSEFDFLVVTRDQLEARAGVDKKKAAVKKETKPEKVAHSLFALDALAHSLFASFVFSFLTSRKMTRTLTKTKLQVKK